MARGEVIASVLPFVCALSFCATIQAQDATKSPQPETTAPAPNRKETDPLVQLVRSLTPEQKTRLIESIKTWQELSPETKQALRARETTLKKNITEEIDAALEGVEVTPEQKTAFEKRYRDERRKLDVSLRTELDSRRKASLQEIIGKIKADLSLSPK